MIVGTLLNQLFDRTQQTIDQLKNSGLHLEMEAGAQLRQTIEQAQVAYADSLNLTMNLVDQTTRNTLDQLGTLVNGAINRNATVMQNMAANVQEIANTLPFHNDRPQLTNMLPRFILRTDNSPIRFQFFGNFEHASNQAYAPRLTFHGQHFNATHITTQRLEFSVLPNQVFPNNQLQNARRVVFSDGTLEAYYPGTILRATAIYHLTIGALPATPGTITLNYQRERIQREVRLCQTQRQHIDSRKNSGGNDVINHLFKANPSEEWHVKKGTSQANASCGGRHEGPFFVSDTGDQVIWCGSTIKNTIDIGGKESGWMDVSISFDEWQDVTITDRFSENIDLRWGNSKVLLATEFPIGKWTVIFDSFDGEHHEFAGSDLNTSPYLKLENQGGGMVIKAARPRELENI